MFNYLEQLRRKPVAYRKRVLLLSTTTITTAIVLVWLSTFGFYGSPPIIDEGAVKEEMRPIDEIATSIVNLYKTVKEFGSGVFGSSTAK